MSIRGFAGIRWTVKTLVNLGYNGIRWNPEKYLIMRLINLPDPEGIEINVNGTIIPADTTGHAILGDRDFETASIVVTVEGTSYTFNYDSAIQTNQFIELPITSSVYYRVRAIKGSKFSNWTNRASVEL